jgi:ATP-dependent Clp protease ATP-binding subunit ClpA
MALQIEYEITVTFGDQTSQSRKVTNFPADDNGFIGWFCNTFEIASEALDNDDRNKIRNALNELINGEERVVINLNYTPEIESYKDYSNLLEFFAHHLQNTNSSNFWIHYSTWPDLWEKIKLIFFKENPPRNFERLVVCDMRNIITYDLPKDIHSEGHIRGNEDWSIINDIDNSENTIYIMEDFDIALATDNNYYGDDDGLKSAVKNLIQENRLNKKNNYFIVAANASDEIKIPSQLRGFWVTYKDSSKDFPVLENLGENITAKARAGKINPIQGRDEEINEIIQKLSMEKYNNVLLLGKPGVGKTALINGLAYRIEHDTDVPDRLKNVKIFDLPVSNIIKDTSVAGSLEAKISNLRDEVKAHRREVVVFIDEFHQLMNNDTIRNVLKPALANGEFPCIGATTDGEYKQYVADVDSAFEQRFLKINLDELPKDIIKSIFQNIIENSNRNITINDRELEYLYYCCRKLEPLLALPRSGEKVLINILEELEDGQNISQNIIKRHFSVGKISSRLNKSDERKGIRENISRAIKGQDKQLEIVLDSIRDHLFLLTKIENPLVLMFMGPTGTGKTQLAFKLAEELWGENNRCLLFNMGSVDFKTSITGAPPGYVGYENSSPLLDFMKTNDSGIIILDEFEKVFIGQENNKDKISVLDSFLEIFDKGTTTDNRGKKINCRPFIFILTTNLGADKPADISPKDKTNILIDAGLKREFIGRLRAIEVFSKISREKAVEIINEQLSDYNELPDFSCKFELDENMIEFILEESDFDTYGARHLINTFHRIMKGIMANNIEILDNNRTYKLGVKNGEIAFS